MTPLSPEALHALYKHARVSIAVSENGRTMPWHSLRHTFGTECAARGVPLPTIKELMGHADIQATMRYVTVGEASWTPRSSGRSERLGNRWATRPESPAKLL